MRCRVGVVCCVLFKQLLIISRARKTIVFADLGVYSSVISWVICSLENDRVACGLVDGFFVVRQTNRISFVTVIWRQMKTVRFCLIIEGHTSQIQGQNSFHGDLGRSDELEKFSTKSVWTKRTSENISIFISQISK